jgi:iron(III) transport system substrate-binding protein
MRTINRNKSTHLYLSALATLLLAWPLKAHPQEWKTEWDKSLTVADKEGKVVVAGPPGEAYRQPMMAFVKAYPSIKLDFVGIQGRDFAPRIMQERRAGQFLWDINVGGASTMFNVLIPAKVLDPLRPALILPDILEDKNWRGGFNEGWTDLEKKYIYGFTGYVDYAVYMNHDVIPETEFSRAEDLWDPKWKGKIVWHDPRREGIGTNNATVILLNFGEEALRRLLKDQGVVITEDYRQLAEWVVRGRYPIGIGVNAPHLQVFQKQGVGKNVKPFKEPKLASSIPGWGNMASINRPAHPNAARVYINWLLSKEGQSIWARTTLQNSRRLDVEVADPESLPQTGARYINTQNQEHQEARKKVNQIAKEIFQ